MPKAICLIEKKRNFLRISLDVYRFESGDWVVSIEKAESLIGARIYFFDKQADESYYGGVIESYHLSPLNPEKKQDRVVFTFLADEEGRGFKAGADGWKNDQKTIY
jgi:hypothetical protein